MKPSHLTTPRSLDECHFDTRGQAIHGGPNHAAWRIADAIAAAVLVGLLAWLAITWGT